MHKRSITQWKSLTQTTRAFTYQILPYREKKKRPSDAMAACGSSTSRNTGRSYTSRLLSFAEYAKDAQPEVLATLIQTIVERIYIVDKDDERYCHIFIKGCSGEDYTGFFQTAGYIEQNTVPVCDSEQYCISKLVYASLCRSVSRKYLDSLTSPKTSSMYLL